MVNIAPKLACEVDALGGFAMAAANQSAKKIPVILDTDIGDDIDDTWALGMLLKCPELDLKLVVGDFGRAQYRAKLLAKFLQTAGRTDVAVGVGLDGGPRGEGAQAPWVKDYDLKSYPGKIHQDGVQALIDAIMQSKDKITLLCIGPAPNIAAALEREPQIAQRARFVGMYGSLRLGYSGRPRPSGEWNVKKDVKACQKVFTAPWEMTITPLDTCGIVSLDGERYAKVRDSKDIVAVAIIENYRMWNKDKAAAEQRSSVLFDCVAVYLAFSLEFCKMERLGIGITDGGMTVIDDKAKAVDVATEWKNKDAFLDLLVARLTGAK